MDRELEIAAAASVGGLAKSAARHVTRVGVPCANCGTALAGAYCHACGQLAEDFERSIGALLIETVENLFHVDGRLFRTLPRLAFDPAALTRDYLAGRRASQMPPLRLFLVVVLMVFFAGSLRDLVKPNQVQTRAASPASLLPRIGPDGEASFTSKAKFVSTWLRPRLTYAATHQREFAMALGEWLHRIAIVFLPISTLLLSVLFVFQRRFFIFDHAIFAMHSLGFMGLLFTLMTLLGLLAPLRGVAGGLAVVAPVHLYVHMRGVYRVSRLGTLARMFLLGLFSAIVLGLLFTGVLALELNGMGAA